MRGSPHPLHRPIQHCRHRNSRARRQRIDEKILPSRVPTRHPKLQEFERTNKNNGHRGGEQPMSGVSQTERQPDQHEGQRVLALLAEIGMRPEAAPGQAWRR